MLIWFVACGCNCDCGATTENGDDEVKGLLGIEVAVFVVAAKGLFIAIEVPNGLLLLLVEDKNGFVAAVVVVVIGVTAGDEVANGLFDMDENGSANGLLLILLDIPKLELNGLLLSLLVVVFEVSFGEKGLYCCCCWLLYDGEATILNGLVGDNDNCCNDDGFIDTAEAELLSGDNFLALAVWRGELLFSLSSSSSPSPS